MRIIYENIRKGEPTVTRKERLELTFRAINDVPGAGGVSPTLLVFGVIHKLPRRQTRDVSLLARVKTSARLLRYLKN